VKSILPASIEPGVEELEVVEAGYRLECSEKKTARHFLIGPPGGRLFIHTLGSGLIAASHFKLIGHRLVGMVGYFGKLTGIKFYG
jgi:hypothetical protein